MFDPVVRTSPAFDSIVFTEQELNAFPKRIFGGRSLTTPNHTRVRKSANSIQNVITPCNRIYCLVSAVYPRC